MTREEARKRAEELVGKMTIEEKASQLRFDAPAIERLGIPAYNWWNEALHGVARAGVSTMFPQAIGMAATFDEEALKEVGEVIADEGRAKYNFESRRGDRDIYKGLTFWAPNVNIFRDPRWGRGHETYGEDPFLTSRMGVNFIEGVQQGSEYMEAAACAKHFAVHSGPEAERHHFNAIASKKDMEETYLPAFEAAVKEAKVEAVMGAYNRTNGEVCCGSEALQKILRGNWGFKGHFVSDCWAIQDFHKNHKITGTPEESVVLALKNGTDVNCGCTYQRIMNAYEAGMIDEKYITESAVRLFTTRFLLGMFDKTAYDSIPGAEVESPEHLALEDRVAKESFVLLKNTGVLPLDKSKLNAVAVVGPNANSRSALKGNYHGDASRYVTVLEGIQDYLGSDVRVYYSEGCDLKKDNCEDLSNQTSLDRLAEAQECAELSDVVIVVLGLDETMEGEEGDAGNAYFSGDKKDLELPFQQLELLRGMLMTGKPVILVNMTGSAVNLRTAEDHADAVLQVWYPGGRGGANVASVLFGETSPSGKLPVTFYETDKDLPEFTDYSMKGRTYRYYEGTPLYPFGYGLTYGDCRVIGIEADVVKREMLSETAGKASQAGKTAFGGSDDFGAEKGIDGVNVKMTVTNAGKYAADETAQVYVKAEDAWDAEFPHLSAFGRVHLEPGETKEITLRVRPHELATVDEDGIRKIRAEKFHIYGGFSQPDARSGELTGHDCMEETVIL
jgi:beta-glucosidase